MSVGSAKDDIKPITETKCIEVTIGSHYALQVALQTMKERCQQLQQRLVEVEGENMNLRVEKERSNSYTNVRETEKDVNTNEGGGNSKSETEHLQQQVTQLVRQKSRLTHHIFMVANENKQLWNRLNRLTQANQSLGSHLTQISDTLNQHPARSNSESSKSVLQSGVSRDSFEGEPTDSNNTLPLGAINSRPKYNIVLRTQDDEKIIHKDSRDVKEESLEEISLKLIKSFLQEKTELEQQYAQMVEIQTNCPSFNVSNLGFTYEDGDESIVDEVKQHCEKLQGMRETVKEQHLALKAVLCNLERIKNGNTVCHQCQDHTHVKTTEAEVMEMESLGTWAATGSYREDIQRQLNQVVEPPSTNTGTNSSTGVSRHSSSVIPRRLTERSASFNTTSMPTETQPQEDWMCPLCSCIYPRTQKFDEYQQHVMDHFAAEDDEAYSISNNFEIISNTLGTQ